MYIYIYIYIEREGEREICVVCMPTYVRYSKDKLPNGEKGPRHHAAINMTITISTTSIIICVLCLYCSYYYD